MSERSDRFRQKAAECERMARGVTDRSAKATYLDLAKQWSELAQTAEDLEREKKNSN
jgi:hypothetical protein